MNNKCNNIALDFHSSSRGINSQSNRILCKQVNLHNMVMSIVTVCISLKCNDKTEVQCSYF